MNYKFLDTISRFETSVTREELIYFFSMARYGTAYFFDDEDNYLGYLTYRQFVEDGLEFNRDSLKMAYIEDYKDYIKDHKKIREYFNVHKDARSGLIINDGKVVGQIAIKKMHTVTFDVSKKLGALYKLSAYSELLEEYLESKNYKNVGIIVPSGKEDLIPPYLHICTLETAKDYDFVLDGYLIREIYSYYDMSNIKPLDEVLAIVLYRNIAKKKNIQDRLYIFARLNKRHDDFYEDEKVASSLVEKLGDAFNMTDYINKVYADYPDDLAFVLHHGKALSTSLIVQNNGAYKYVANSTTKGDIKDNARVVPSNKNNPKHVYIYGPCLAYSLFSTKESSVAEFLQQSINSENIPYDVKNYGIAEGIDNLNDITRLIYNDYQEDDIHIVMSDFSEYVLDELENLDFKIYNMGEVFKGEHYYFLNHWSHLTPKGNKILADFVFRALDFKSSAKAEKLADLRLILPDNMFFLRYHDVERYKEYLRYESQGITGKIGFIHMNASPMTNGHAHLIEYARQHSDFLYIFVIEENYNALPFQDRLNLVKEYVKNYDDVKVLSGEVFLGSRYTYSAYFNKECEFDTPPEEEVKSFDTVIMPVLHVDIRFMGEEPNSLITRRLNDYYKAYMESIGKELVIIPRKKLDGKCISATDVREYAKAGDFSAVARLVPEHVVRYLQELTREELDEA